MIDFYNIGSSCIARLYYGYKNDIELKNICFLSIELFFLFLDYSTIGLKTKT